MGWKEEIAYADKIAEEIRRDKGEGIEDYIARIEVANVISKAIYKSGDKKLRAGDILKLCYEASKEIINYLDTGIPPDTKPTDSPIFLE